MFACASMGCIIVRIAGRPATCAWLKKMTAEPVHTELVLHNDSRLLAAVSAVVSHAAQRAGLTPDCQEGFSGAVIDACRETFALISDQGNNHSALKVIVEDFHDRVEVTLEHSGEALPTAGLDTFCAGADEAGAAGISQSLQDTRVDRVQYETRDGKSCMRLIKYCGGRKATV